MRKAPRQKTGWNENDWINHYWRRIYNFRPGVAKWIKRTLARRRRHEKIEL